MTNDYNIAVLSVIKMIVQNNAGCVARKLREAGYETRDFIPASEIESALFQLHTIEPKLFYQVMRNCEWNMGNTNWTNDSKVREQIISVVQTHTGQNADKANWWNITIDYLQKQSVIFK